VLTLRRPLQIRVGKTQQIVGEQILVSKGIQCDRVVQTAAEVAVVAIGVEEQRLEEALFSEIDAELSGVLAHYLGQAIADLIGVTFLRQLAFKVIADSKSARNADKRHALAIRAETWRDPELWVGRDHTRHVGGAGKADRRHCGTA